MSEFRERGVTRWSIEDQIEGGKSGSRAPPPSRARARAAHTTSCTATTGRSRQKQRQCLDPWVRERGPHQLAAGRSRHLV